MIIKEKCESISPTVFIVEDDHVVCDSLRWLFESVSLRVEFFRDAQSFLNNYDPTRYGCLLIDVRLPGMSGLKLQEHLVERNNPLPIIMITGHGDVALAVRAMKLGAKDFILKPFNNDFLLEQIQAVLKDSMEEQVAYQQFISQLARLTSREREILKLVLDGIPSKEIAVKLNISLSTVEQHRAHLLRKMRVRSAVDLLSNYFCIKQKICI